MGSYTLTQLGYGVPLLIVYLVAIILSAVFVRKYPLSAMLTLAGAVILFVNLIGLALIQGYLVRTRIESGWSVAQYDQITIVVGSISAIVRALGTALLIGAIFVGRTVKAVREPAI